MNAHLAYGKTRISAQFPDNGVVIVEPTYVPGTPDEAAAVRSALELPIGSRSLREVVADRFRTGDPGRGGRLGNIGIVVNDITRATPYHVILPAIFEQLSNVSDDQIIIFVATGTHRSNSDSELEGILGRDIVRRFRIAQNDALDSPSHVAVGTTRNGNRLLIHREFAECAVRIITGFVEPHFFAGFSGGGKAVMPGLAQLDTIVRNHSANNLDDPRATWGVTAGNPIWEEVNEAASTIGIDFLINVTLNRDKQITGVFAGDLTNAHLQGCEFIRETAMVRVPRLFDIVVTSNSGHPLDLNLYQSVKGMSCAAQIVKPGGAIIVVAECWDGIPDHGRYGDLLRDAKTPDELLQRIHAPGFHCHDMWQAQLHAQICQKATVHLFSDHISDKECRGAFLVPCADISETVAELCNRSGRGATVCVLPEGPQTIPYVAMNSR